MVEQRGVGGEALLAHQLLVVELALVPRAGGGAGCAAWAGRCPIALVVRHGPPPVRSRVGRGPGPRPLSQHLVACPSCHRRRMPSPTARPSRRCSPAWSTTPPCSRPATRRSPEAVAEHRVHRTSGYAACVGSAARPRLPRPATSRPLLDGDAAARRRHRPPRHPRRRAWPPPSSSCAPTAGVERRRASSSAGRRDWRADATSAGCPLSLEVPRGLGPGAPRSPTSPRDASDCRAAAGEVPHRRDRRRGPGPTRPSWRRSSARPSTTTWASSSPAACTTPSAAPTTARSSTACSTSSPPSGGRSTARRSTSSSPCWPSATRPSLVAHDHPR